MKYVKRFGLLAVGVAALTAFAASASATTITSPTGTPYTGEIHATSEGHAKFANPIANMECHMTVKGTSLTHGSGQTARLAITSLLWGTSGNLNGTCTNSWHFTTSTPGELEIHWKGEHEGTVTWNGALWKTTRFLVPCSYQTVNTHIGTLTDSNKTGTTAAPSTATIDISAKIPIVASESSELCGSGLLWEGSLVIDAPMNLDIDP